MKRSILTRDDAHKLHQLMHLAADAQQYDIAERLRSARDLLNAKLDAEVSDDLLSRVSDGSENPAGGTPRNCSEQRGPEGETPK